MPGIEGEGGGDRSSAGQDSAGQDRKITKRENNIVFIREAGDKEYRKVERGGEESEGRIRI